MSGTSKSPSSTCPECGAPFTPQSGASVCPQCLLRAGLPTDAGQTAVVTGSHKAGVALPEPGSVFGGYRLVRILGEGGMGRVYEAEHLESGRRVALKVLGHSLDSPEARRRFFREGRIAASINHPHSVYVFGTEEIDGAPAISMELLPGGTLQDRVAAEGPLPVGEAVDAALQLIAGLEAAQAFGILHRDIKPSNCFVDHDGTIKIGDFGLSISSSMPFDATLTAAGTFMGTPAFSSPEQVRGEELTARSDIYSVGVTLYYLLTGRIPFESDNLVHLLAAVLEKPALPPERHRPGLPPALSAAVQKCMQKLPDQRFASYEELRQALLPFASTTPAPASLGPRFAAGFVDLFLFMVLGMFVVLGTGLPLEELGATPWQSKPLILISIASTLGYCLYFTLLEGWWGATLGKRLLRLRVIDAARQPPGLCRVALRAFVYVLVPPLPVWICMWVVASRGGRFDDTVAVVSSYSYYLLLALLFSTARRRNGLAALQDLASGTRVVQKPVLLERPRLDLPAEEEEPASSDLPFIGPYHLLGTWEDATESPWLLAYDMRLLRKVWIRRLPDGSPPLSPAFRQLRRVTRLRWLNGRRQPGDCWDAYEAASGRPLLKLAQAPQTWKAVRFWLLDLAEEFAAAEQEHTLSGPLTLDRIWITADGRAKWLDLPAPGLPEVADPEAAADARALMQRMATTAMTGTPARAARGEDRRIRPPLPVHARNWMAQLARGGSLSQLATSLTGLLGRPTQVSRGWRFLLTAGCAVVPLFTLVSMLMVQQIFANWQVRYPEYGALRSALGLLESAVKGGDTEKLPPREVIEQYVAGRFGGLITNRMTWDGVNARLMFNPWQRSLAERAMATQAALTPDSFRQASLSVEPSLPPQEGLVDAFPFLRQPFLLCAGMLGGLLIYVGLPAILAGLLFRGGLLMRLLGLAMVGEQGEDASRMRILFRYLLAWSPVLSSAVVMALLLPLAGMNVTGSVVGAWVVGWTAWSNLRRDRSLQDRLAGTWLVRR